MQVLLKDFREEPMGQIEEEFLIFFGVSAGHLGEIRWGASGETLERTSTETPGEVGEICGGILFKICSEIQKEIVEEVPE